MEIKDFKYEDETFLYERDGIPFIIYVWNRNWDIYTQSFSFCITTEKQGEKAISLAKEIEMFLQSHFYEHPKFRMTYLFTEKPPLEFEIRVDKEEFHYYYKEYAQILFVSLLTIKGLYTSPNIVMLYVLLFSIFLGYFINEKMTILPLEILDKRHHILQRKRMKRAIVKIICPGSLLLILIALLIWDIIQKQ